MSRDVNALLAVLAASVAIGCGGPKSPPERPPGDTHVVAVGATVDAGVAAPDAALPDAGPPPIDAGPPPPPYAFELKNEGDRELQFPIDKGWQPVLFAWTGKKPKAVPYLLFEKPCTGACDAATPEEICPVCKEAEKPRDRQKEEKAETKREIAPAGGSVTVPWDGKVFVYEKAPKELKKKKCECWRKADPPAETFTIKACGFRPGAKAGQASTPVCAEAEVALPGITPTTITLVFPK
jgi:hypothetical protein